MFVDQAKVRVRGGRGGNGCLSFRREKFVPRGGPDGGDGGNGGNVVFQSDTALHTLLDLRYHAFTLAERGVHGKGKNMHGKCGQDTIVRVPVGTLLRDEATLELLWDFQTDGERFVAAQGGRGGRGNARFATSTNRAPRRFTEGQEGEDRWLLVELKLLADVGLLGFPNAGKSTLISAISAAKPKIADYPFTTLTPNLGVVELHDYATCVVADIPGLVPDAHRGKGLGHQFLKHIERTRLLVHLLDLNPTEDDRTPWTDFLAINHELACFNPELARVPQIVVATKMDVPDVAQRFPDMQQQFAAQGHDVLPISAATGMGLDTLRSRLSTSLQALAEGC
ncbi:MAG: GTPase CgtA [Candidatus Entotheonella factor]|uniref:GTPase Obg n=1 Tax=Entotheonella factor TaxID=1429438 RepID=W4LG68_ENTF1|nr:GTPase ObgE [Candidatus Entotheonella palauensis]ETW96316.1 MAG: GTPase CgtA [Candidatus Entotheonella factor]